jgi:hypothetical protein
VCSQFNPTWYRAPADPEQPLGTSAASAAGPRTGRLHLRPSPAGQISSASARSHTDPLVLSLRHSSSAHPTLSFSRAGAQVSHTPALPPVTRAAAGALPLALLLLADDPTPSHSVRSTVTMENPDTFADTIAFASEVTDLDPTTLATVRTVTATVRRGRHSPWLRSRPPRALLPRWRLWPPSGPPLRPPVTTPPQPTPRPRWHETWRPPLSSRLLNSASSPSHPMVSTFPMGSPRM